MKAVKTKQPFSIYEHMPIIRAYSDCNENESERSLNFFHTSPVKSKDLQAILEIAIPNGYNDFEAKTSIPQLIEMFGEDASYFVARENSVCIYIKPNNTNVWFNNHRAKNISCDEFMFCPKLQMFRVWWD